MRIINPRVEIKKFNRGEMLRVIERVARTCYKSEDKITDKSASSFVSSLVARGHTAMLEHENLSVKFIIDRGVSHELVRHRHCGFAQESTRYVRSSQLRTLCRIDDDVIALYEKGYSGLEISKISNHKYSYEDVCRVLEGTDLNTSEEKGLALFMEDFFEYIDSPEKAYLLGFILGGGYINQDSKQIVIGYKEEDRWFLLKMVRGLIRPGTNSLCLKSSKMLNDLMNKGIIEDKTHKFREKEAKLLWDSVPEYLIPDLLRGLLDSDGSIIFYDRKTAGDTKLCDICFNGPEHLLLKISSWLRESLNYNTEVQDYGQSEILRRIYITDPGVGISLFNLMYSNFKFPYGHPKSIRGLGVLGKEVEFESWGDPRFQVIKPFFFEHSPNLWVWAESMDRSESDYSKLSNLGSSPQEARSVLPNSLKTEVWVTASLREWRSIFELRCSKGAHPQMRQVMIPLLLYLQGKLPPVFGDIEYDRDFQDKHLAKVEESEEVE